MNREELLNKVDSYIDTNSGLGWMSYKAMVLCLLREILKELTEKRSVPN